MLNKLLREECQLQLKVDHTILRPGYEEVPDHMPDDAMLTAEDQISHSGECFMCASAEMSLNSSIATREFCGNEAKVCDACRALVELIQPQPLQEDLGGASTAPHPPLA